MSQLDKLKEFKIWSSPSLQFVEINDNSSLLRISINYTYQKKLRAVFIPKKITKIQLDIT